MWGRPGFLIRRLHQIGAALFYDDCHSESLTPLQVGMLTALSMNPWLDQKAIGRELALDRTTTAEVLKRLADKGLVETRVNPDDRRSRLSVITQNGLNLIHQLQDSIHRSQERLLEPLSEQERVVFMRILAQLVDAHERTAGQGSEEPTEGEASTTLNKSDEWMVGTPRRSAERTARSQRQQGTR